jgi:hypothetical protein
VTSKHHDLLEHVVDHKKLRTKYVISSKTFFYECLLWSFFQHLQKVTVMGVHRKAFELMFLFMAWGFVWLVTQRERHERSQITSVTT